MDSEEVGFPVETARGRSGCDENRNLSKMELKGWEMYLFGRKKNDRT